MGTVSKPELIDPIDRINNRIMQGCGWMMLWTLCIVGCTAGMVHRAHSQGIDGVICTEDGEYERCTPGEVIQAGNGAFAVDVQTLETQITDLGSRTQPLASTTATNGQVLTYDTGSGGANYGWQDAASGGVTYETKAGQPVAGTGGAGEAETVSRGDHSHPITGLATADALQEAAADATAALTKANEAQNEIDDIRQVSDPSGIDDGHVLTKTTSSGSASYGWAAPSGGGGTSVVYEDNPGQPVAGTGAPGSSTTVSRGDHAHPITGLAAQSDLNAEAAKVAANTKALNAVRQVPDPAHQADGEVLTVASGAAVWKAGGGGGGAGGWEMTALGTATDCDADECEFALGAGTAAADDNCGDTPCKIQTGDLLSVVGPVAGSDRDQALQIFHYVGSASLPTGTIPDTVTVACNGGINYFNRNTFHQFCVFTNGVYFYDTDTYDVTGTWTLWRHRPAGGGGGGGSTTLSDGTPSPLGTASPGAGTAASRGDHVHQLPADIAKTKTDLATTDAEVAAQGMKIETNTANITANKNAIDAIDPLPDDSGASQNDVLLINESGKPEWSSGINQATHLNANNIVKNGDRIAQIDNPAEAESGGAFRNGHAYRLRDCEIENSNRLCTASWEPERDLIDTHDATSWGGTGSWSKSDATAANLHQVMRGGSYPPYSSFELSVKFTHSGKANYYLILIAGLPPGDTLGLTDTAVFFGETSNNTLSGHIEYAKVEIGPTAFTVSMGANTLTEQSVQFRLYGVR